jgi:hypothetical protein
MIRRAFLLMALSGCYATTPPPINCDPVVVQCNPAEYPPLFAILPPWPFPVLIEEPKEAPKPAETPGSRLLQKLTK